MAFDSKQADQQLMDVYEKLNLISSNAGVRLQNAAMYASALLSLTQAEKCRLEAMAWGLMTMGLAQREARDIGRQFIEDETARDKYEDTRLELVKLTEDIVARALEGSCSCQRGAEPSPVASV